MRRGGLVWPPQGCPAKAKRILTARSGRVGAGAMNKRVALGIDVPVSAFLNEPGQ
jgi:hypothetical protein